MTKEIFKVQTERGDLFKIPIDDLLNFDLEYSPQIARFDFKDGTFIAFNRNNITYIWKAKVEICECKDYGCEFKNFSPEEYVNKWEGKTNVVFSNRR